MKRFVCGILSLLLLFSLVACEQQEEAMKEADEGEEIVYEPEKLTLKGKEDNIRPDNYMIEGESLYYSRYSYEDASNVVCEYSLKDGSAQEVALQMSQGKALSYFTVDKEGAVYALMVDIGSLDTEEDGFVMPDTYLGKFDAQGKSVFEKDITEAIRRAGELSVTLDIAVDGQGKIYVCMNQGVLLFDEDGTEKGQVAIRSGLVHGIGIGRDGKAYVSYEDLLAEIDFAGKKTKEIYHNVPGISGRMSVGITRDFLFHDGYRVYEYSLETESAAERFEWLDYDINGSYVSYVGVAGDNTLMAITRDEKSEVVTLVKFAEKSASKAGENNADKSTEASLKETTGEDVLETAEETAGKTDEEPPKEEIVIATWSVSQELQDAVWRFNSENPSYRATIKQYWDGVSVGSEAETKMKIDLVSGENCPDIVDLQRLEAQQLAVRGVLEDLTPYLEESEILDKENFLDNVLEGYTYDGKLVMIPPRFQINTLVGKTSEVGEEMGWTLQEMCALAEKHPDSELVEGMTQGDFVYYYMLFNQNQFVDWEKGECHFNSREFRELLEFATAYFPNEIDWDAYAGKALVEEKQAGAILLEKIEGVWDFQEIQLYAEIFGEEVTFIGFPITDGSVGCKMYVYEGMYGIPSQAEHKEGAWQFIESYLANSADTWGEFGFPVMKDKLQDKIDNIYFLDENGERMLDEDGNPMPVRTSATYTFDDWVYEYHTPTEEEIEQTLEMISVAKPGEDTSNAAIRIIITEESDAYFLGQKSLDEVVEIIQNRAQVYVEENR